MRTNGSVLAIAAASALSLLAASCGPDVEPCTTCINVQGTWSITMDSKSAAASSCDQLYIDGRTWEAELYQTGSKLEMPRFFGSAGGFDGKLFADDSAQLGPKRVGVSNTSPVVYANLTLSGRFAGEEATRQFSGLLLVHATFDGTICTLSTPVRMTRKATAP
ncbi:MAG: hypothetical protein QM765_25390 [Myxococcales bacterium]